MADAPAPVPVAPAPTVEAAAPVAPVAPVAAPVVADAAPVATPTPEPVAAEPAPSAIEGAAEPVAEAPAVEAEAPATEAVVEPDAPAPITYEAFKMPAGVTADEAELSAFSTDIAEMGLTQEQGQKLVDRYGAVAKKFADNLVQQQADQWAETNAKWQADFHKQYGNRSDTVLNDAKSALMRAIPDAKKRGEVWTALSLTGAGNHPAVIGAFAALEKKFNERGAPAPSVPRKGSGQTPEDRRYGNRG